MNNKGLSEIVLCAPFDNIHTRHIRLLHEASRLGPVHIYLWDNAAINTLTAKDCPGERAQSYADFNVVMVGIAIQTGLN